jgi:hypothetical protein
MKRPCLGLALIIAAFAVGCGGDPPADTSGAGGAGGDGAGGAGGGAGGAGGNGGVACSVTEPCAKETGTCIFPQGACAPDAKGTCQQVTCGGTASGPACGCDGVVVEDSAAKCSFWEQGKPIADPELCATGTFVCGTLSCKRHVEVCVEMVPGPPGGTSTYECKPVADVGGTCEHGIADCNCLDVSTTGGICTSDADHQETIKIYLP